MSDRGLQYWAQSGAHEAWIADYEANDPDKEYQTMGIKVSAKGTGDYKQPPADMYAARCFRVIDLGTQTSKFEGEERSRRQVMISFELSDCMMDPDEEGKVHPFSVSSFFTLSLHEKSGLRKTLVGWRGQEFTEKELESFDLDAVLGAPCLLQVVHNEKGKARVATITTLPKSMQCMKAHNPKLSFSLDEFDGEVFEALPNGIQNMIRQSPEFAKLTATPAAPGNPNKPVLGDMEDDIPF